MVDFPLKDVAHLLGDALQFGFDFVPLLFEFGVLSSGEFREFTQFFIESLT